jgi:hypothetical protein
MRQTKNRTVCVASIVALLGLCGASQGAIMIGSNAAAGVGNTAPTFSGALDYSPLTSTTGQLTVVLTNTSDVALNARLTAFVFNVGSAVTPSSLLLTAVGGTLTNISNGSASPFGASYVGGAGTGGQFEGGGSPNNGLASGQTGTYTFRITSTSAPTLTANTFLSGPYDQDFVVRFRGLADGSSSKIPAALVPAPGVGAMALMGGLVAVRRKRK